jgi:hypothetical protein
MQVSCSELNREKIILMIPAKNLAKSLFLLLEYGNSASIEAKKILKELGRNKELTLLTATPHFCTRKTKASSSPSSHCLLPRPQTTADDRRRPHIAAYRS